MQLKSCQSIVSVTAEITVKCILVVSLNFKLNSSVLLLLKNVPSMARVAQIISPISYKYKQNIWQLTLFLNQVKV